MQRWFNCLWGHPVTLFAVFPPMLFAIYRWWQTGQGGMTALVLVLAMFSITGASEAERKYSAERGHARPQRPSMAIRFLGHPMIAIPIVLYGLLCIVIGIYRIYTGEMPLAWPSIIALQFVVVPTMSFLFAFDRREEWKKATRGIKAVAPRPADPPPMPLASLLRPSQPLVVPPLPDAMQRLSPPLLELVRQGMAERKAVEP